MHNLISATYGTSCTHTERLFHCKEEMILDSYIICDDYALRVAGLKTLFQQKMSFLVQDTISSNEHEEEISNFSMRGSSLLPSGVALTRISSL
jgi:hypothetical protein